MKRTWLSLSALCFWLWGLLFMATLSSAQVPAYVDGREYIISNATVTVQWDLVSIATAYEARLTLFLKDPITYFALAGIPGNENSVTFTRPRAGHFRAEVRACLTADCDCSNPDNCSRWAESTNKDDASVDGIPGAWWFYWKVPKPVFE